MPTPATLKRRGEAGIDAAEAIVIGPSNPIASIGPILAVPGLREALVDADAPVVAVSPLVGGRSLKGPTEAFLAWAGLEVSDASIASNYAGIADGLVVDSNKPAGRHRRSRGWSCTRPMPRWAHAEARVRVARETLEFARSLAA